MCGSVCVSYPWSTTGFCEYGYSINQKWSWYSVYIIPEGRVVALMASLYRPLPEAGTALTCTAYV